MFGLISPENYYFFYSLLLGCLAILQIIHLQFASNDYLLYREPQKGNEYWALILTIFLIIFFGTRDPDSFYFADTAGYAQRYYAIQYEGDASRWYEMYLDSNNEFLFSRLILVMAGNGFSVTAWFTVIAAIYILGIYFAVKIFFPNNLLLACICAYLNFGFYSGAVNGLRNSMGLSMVLVAMALYYKYNFDWKKSLLPLLFLVAAYEFHSSTFLPSFCLLCSIFIIKKPKIAVLIWFLSIVVSLAVGNTIASFFEMLGFDDRMSKYLDDAHDSEFMSKSFSRTGFRLDFLLFSALPIVWGWIVFKYRNVKDKAYDVIYNTYVLANSFWVLVIRAAFSNRFAALSWFLYFLVLIYPALKYNMFPNQGRIVSLILLCLLGITFII